MNPIKVLRRKFNLSTDALESKLRMAEHEFKCLSKSKNILVSNYQALTETKNKLDLEVETLKARNKKLKDKLNRASVYINDFQDELADARKKITELIKHNHKLRTTSILLWVWFIITLPIIIHLTAKYFN